MSQLRGFLHWLQCAGVQAAASSECFVRPFGSSTGPRALDGIVSWVLLLADADLRRERPQLSTCENCFLFSRKKGFKRDQQLRTEVSIVCIIVETQAAGRGEFGSEIIR